LFNLKKYANKLDHDQCSAGKVDIFLTAGFVVFCSISWHVQLCS